MTEEKRPEEMSRAELWARAYENPDLAAGDLDPARYGAKHITGLRTMTGVQNFVEFIDGSMALEEIVDGVFPLGPNRVTVIEPWQFEKMEPIVGALKDIARGKRRGRTEGGVKGIGGREGDADVFYA